MLTLRYPTQADRSEVEKVCLNEWAQEWGFIHYFETKLDKDVDKVIDFLPKMTDASNLPEGHVPCSFFLVFNEKNQVVGRTSIRHELTDFLMQQGGHIGYGVMPEFRRRGYATEILKLSLEYCKNNLGLNRVLVTCDDDNIGSFKTIESNGGVLENKVVIKGQDPLCRRYWIDIK